MSIVILGAGIAGLSVGYHLKQQGVDSLLIEKASCFGGLCSSQRTNDFVYDFGVKVSFTDNEYVRQLFSESVGGDFVEVDVCPMNYWNGYWLKHQPQNNLYGLPQNVIDQVLAGFKRTLNKSDSDIRNYRDWCEAQFGQYFARQFNHRYTRKFWTVEPQELTTDWVGQRFSRPYLNAMIAGSLGENKDRGHYVKKVRYPRQGGYISFLNKMTADLQFSYQVVPRSLDVKNKKMTLSDGTIYLYEHLVSTIPLPELIRCIVSVPQYVLDACDQLKWTSLLMFNFSVDHKVKGESQWNYYYDEDIPYTRLVYASKFSVNNAESHREALQAEIPYSPYRPLQGSRHELVKQVMTSIARTEKIDLSHLHFLGEIDIPYGYVLYNHDRNAALKVIHQFLDENNIYYCGRFGEWAYLWSDEALLSGKTCAESVLSGL